MRNFKLHLFKLLIFIIIICYSCGKPCRKEGIERCEAHPLYLKYFGSYQIGNYWIFESEISEIKDSLFVESLSYDIGFLNEETCEEFVRFSFDINVYNSGNLIRLFNPVFIQENSCNDGIVSFYYNTPYENENILIYISSDIASENAEIISEILIDNTIYNDVLHIYVDLREYFFVPQIGLVRYTIPDSNDVLITYNLKSYFIQ
jgi:hypothetical protein